jgi:hypothetical protein
MKNAGLGNKVICQLFDPVPRDPSLLAASLERPPPQVGDTVPEPDECSTVCRHCVIFKEAGYDLPQPFPLFGEGLMPTSSHFLLDFLELRPNAVATGFSLQCEEAAAGSSADEREAKELEGFRFAKAAPSALDRCKAAKLDQAGLIRVKRQRVFPQSLAHRIPESSGVGLILEANDDIVGVSYDDHVTRRLTPSPALGPQVEKDGRDEP